MQKSAMCAYDDHTFCPSTTKRSPSRRADVRTPARSEPAPGLGEALAPDLVRGEERLQVARLLLLGAARDDRRPGHAEPDHADVRRRLGARLLLEVDRLEARREPAAAVLLGPRDARPAALVERAAPCAHLGAVEARLRRRGGRAARPGRFASIHARTSSRKRASSGVSRKSTAAMLERSGAVVSRDGRNGATDIERC